MSRVNAYYQFYKNAPKIIKKMGNNVILDSETPVTLASDEAFWIQTSLAAELRRHPDIHFLNNDNVIKPFLDIYI